MPRLAIVTRQIHLDLESPLFTAAGEHLVGAPDIKMLQPVPAGDPDKGQIRP